VLASLIELFLALAALAAAGRILVRLLDNQRQTNHKND
jgi:hypothetical protein